MPTRQGPSVYGARAASTDASSVAADTCTRAALVVEDRDAAGVALTPGEVDADEVHGPQETGSSRARNARVRSQASAEADGWWSAKSELSKAWLAPS